jgi:nucleoid DNA-binding protein
MKKIIDTYIEKLKQNGKISFKFIGTFYIRPARKGKINGFGEGKEVKYKYRIKFIPSTYLKDMICK